MTKRSTSYRRSRDTGTLTRRELLALTGVAVGGAVLLGPARILAAQAGSSFEVLSVGYVQGSDRFASLRPLPWPITPWVEDPEARPAALRVIPAGSMLMGDPELSQETLSMRVHGLYPGLDEGIELDFDSANLIVYYPSEDPIVGDVAPAIVWGARGGSRANAGSPVRFPVPLRVDGALDLVFEVRPSDISKGTGSNGMRSVTGLSGSDRTVQYATSFTVDPIDGLPKIQRGIYLLGLAPDTWAQPGRLRRDAKGRANPRDLSLVVSFEPIPAEP
jgi:hypothetical protein